MAYGLLSFLSIPTTEAEEGVKGPKYSGRTENVAPVSRMKEMDGLTCLSEGYPGFSCGEGNGRGSGTGPCQSSAARPSRSGTANSEAASPTEERSLVPRLEADRQSTVQCPVFLQSRQGPGGGRGFRQSFTHCPLFPHLKQGPQGDST